MSAKVAKKIHKNGVTGKMGATAKKPSSPPSSDAASPSNTEATFAAAEEEAMVIDLTTESEPLEDAATRAENSKIKGNELYKQGDYRQAIEYYTVAVDLQPDNASYYGNRAASRIMLNQYQEAAGDAVRSVELDENFTKGFLRLARCQVALGELQRALDSYKRALVLEPSNKEVSQQMTLLGRLQTSINEAEARHSSGDHRTALFMLDRALEHMPAAYHLRFRRAEFLVALRRYQDAKEVAEALLRLKVLNSDALWLRGHCLYYMDQPEKAMEHWAQVMRLEPDHVRAAQAYRSTKRLLAAKEEGNGHVAARRWTEALVAYERALAIDVADGQQQCGALAAKLHCNRAHALMQLRRWDEALKDCDAAVQLDERYSKAYLRRAKCFEALERWEEAVRDHEKLMNIAPSQEQRAQLRNAKLELKKSKRKDYYKILGVAKDASEDEVRKAYRKGALVHHPDRHTSADEAGQKEAERQFKEVGEAYAVLSDANKRRRYDAGHDIEDLDGHGHGGGMGGGMGGVDPNEIFRMFFSGGGGGGHHGGHHHHGGGGGGQQQFSFNFG